MNCPYCNKLFKSYKSWHRHKTISHTNEIKPLDWRRSIYDQNPKNCKSCMAPLTYDQRRGSFCGSSCAAQYNNRVDTKTKNEKRISTWRQKLGPLHRDQAKSKRVLACPTCGKEFVAQGSCHKYCNPSCNKTKVGKIQYREACRFYLSPTKHASLYKFELIEKNGWYRPSNSSKGEYNPNGVTWDHLFRVEDGYCLGIDPKIMSHPANAEMVTWKENQKRKASQISYQELLKRIEEWKE